MIYLLLADGFEEVEALAPLDLLRRGGCDVRTVGITGREVTSSHGISVCADLVADEATDVPSLVILPGGLPGATNLDASVYVDRLLCETNEAGGRLAAICAAPFVLGVRGYLRGKRAICYPGFEDKLLGATVAHGENVVTDGRVTTAVGMGASIDFGLELVRLTCGSDVADRMKNGILGR